MQIMFLKKGDDGGNNMRTRRFEKVKHIVGVRIFEFFLN